MNHGFRLTSLSRWILATIILLLILMTLMRLGLYLYFNKQDNSFAELRKAFILGIRFDLRAVSIVGIVLLVLTRIPLLNPVRKPFAEKIWFSVIALFLFVFFLVYIIDFAHYSYLSQRLNASVLNYLEDAAISFNMVWESYPVVWLFAGILAITSLFWFLVWTLFKKIKRRPVVIKRKMAVLEFIICFLLFGWMIFGSVSQYPLRWSDAYALGNDYKANLALNPFESFFNTLQFRKNTYDEEKLREYFPLLAEHFGLDPSQPLNFTRNIRSGQKYNQTPNVILVICESFSAYKSSYFGNKLNTTPFFDSLCNNGIIFDRCFTPAYGTARGVWATITGVPDVEAPATASRNPAAVDQKTIINEFAIHDKFYFLGGSTSWANIRGLLTNNIDGLTIYEQESFNAPKVDVWGISDKNLFLEANRILAKNNKPFFAIIQTALNHRPYSIPEEDLDEFSLENMSLEELRKNNFESIEEYNAFRYSDFGYRKFMEAASKEKYFGNTIFVFIGDHGIPGNTGDLFPMVWKDQRLTQHHVPLLFYAPALFGHQRISRVASQIDVIPTIAGLSRINYMNSGLGRDLLAPVPQKDFAFLFDLDRRQLGLIDSLYFYRKQINTTDEELISVTGNHKVEVNDNTKQAKSEMDKISSAVYEAAKYLLLNNKKNNAGK